MENSSLIVINLGAIRHNSIKGHGRSPLRARQKKPSTILQTDTVTHDHEDYLVVRGKL